LQRAAEESLGDREGAVIVIDPQTGRLRAVVNPRMAFEQTYPPGSAIKPFTMLAALRAGTVSREFRHQCRTRYARDDFEIVCSHPVSKSPFSLSQALAYSCNDFFARVGERLSEGSFNSTLGSFGFGEKTGVNANESAGELPRGEWSAREALGESDHLLVTPVQLITAYAALLNGGRLYRPQQSTDPKMVPREKLRLNITPEHRAVLIEGMRGSVKYGTASKAGIGSLPGYVFGKTGTSTSSIRWRTQGWFAGFAADKGPTGPPQAEKVSLGVLVFLKRAHGSQAAEVAKPIFECGLRNAEERRGDDSLNPSVPPSLHSSVSPSSNPQLIRVRSVSENITREMPMEEYLAGVMAAEASLEDEIEALKTQAIVSRAYALKNLGRHSREGYDLCSTTHCQRFTVPKAGDAISGAMRRAVEETAGMILSDRSGKVIDAYFSAACGGVTANIETLWGAPAPSYLHGVRDDFCATAPHRRWAQRIPADQLARALRSDERTNPGARLGSIIVARRDATGRAETLTIEGERRRMVRGWDFKIIVGRALGWQMIKSSRFEVSRAGADFIFRGSGFGHGLGLCQEGAHVAARRGMNYRQILNFYFPGTKLSQSGSNVQISCKECRSPSSRLERVLEVLFLSPRSGRRNKAWGGAEGGTPGKVWKDIQPVKRAAVHRLSPTSWAADRFTAVPWGLRPGLYAVARYRGLTTSHNVAQKSSLSSEHFRVTYPVKADRRAIERMLGGFEKARADLLRRLEAASLRLAEPGPFEVVVHAATADFIAATGQPGWAAGATRGRRIQLQPLDLLRRRGVLDATLRHEMAHAVMEVLSGATAFSPPGSPGPPRWMAEGLAIHVAGEAATLPRIDNKSRLSRDDLERKLMRSTTAAESRKLYAMAYHEVRAMIESDGESSVWRRVARMSQRSMSMNQQDREAPESDTEFFSHAESRFHSPEKLEELMDEELRCVQCGVRVKDVVCGHRNPCPYCGFPYPVGDCSDLVEN
jgi:SpoIID/LytB domain protein